MKNSLKDLRLALRMLRKSPMFTTVAVATLGLGIGANTALFSVINAVLLRPLPFSDPSRLTDLQALDLQEKNHGGEISYPNFVDWEKQNRSFAAMSAWTTTSFTFTGGDHAESVPGAIVSGNLFSLLGVSPAVGRTFSSDEDQPGNHLPVVLSFEFWQSHFGGDRALLGRRLTLDGRKYLVIGVMPPRFQFPVQTARVEMWTTIAHDQLEPMGLAKQRSASYLNMIGRLKPGVTIAQAQTDLQLIQQSLNKQYPENRPRAARARSEAEAISGRLRPALLILLGAVGFVLLIACGNVANLLLARASARQKEFTVRSALGASRWMLVRLLLIESVVLSMLGAAIGVLLARWGTTVLIRLTPEGLARASEITIDLPVLTFTFVTALLTGIVFGLVPASRVSRAELNRALTENSRGVSAGPGGIRVRNILVTSQLAIALMLLVGATLLLRSFSRLKHVDPGYRADHVLTFMLEVPGSRYPRQQRALFVHNFLESVRSLPGVKSASGIFGLPLSESTLGTSLDVQGRPVPPAQRPAVGFRLIESEYFKTMGMRVLNGRGFVLQDEQGKTPVAIVNETLVRQIFNGENPIGQRVSPGVSFGSEDAPMREIVGVVNDVKSSSISGDPVAEVYAPQTPTDFIGEMTIVARTAGDPNSLVPEMRSLVAAKDTDMPLRDVRTLEDYVSDSISAPRFETLLLGSFAGLALLLTAIGLYGVVSYSVVQRAREMSIRMALGAQRRAILSRVISEGLMLALMGVAAGLAGSMLVTRLMKSLLYGIGASDTPTFLVVPLLLIFVALLASYIPARRATLLDPMAVLRDE